MRFLTFLVLAAPLWLGLTLAPAGWAGEPAPGRRYRTENVFIVVMDGVRYSESFGDPRRKNIPRLAELAAAGALCTAFRNMGETTTNPGHATIMSGCNEHIDNRGGASPAHPSFMQLWRQCSERPAGAAWVIATKDKLAVIADSANPQWKGKFRPSADCGVDGGGVGSGYRRDADTWAAVRKIITRDHPNLALINFAETDEAGHRGDWEAYLEAIRQQDGFVGELWKLLQSDPAYAGRTALIVTNDHGRHLDDVANGFVDHGCDCEGCRRLMLLAIGPDFKRGFVSDTPRQLTDIAPTVGELLGFAVPGSPGKVMTELLAPAAALAPAPAVKEEAQPIPAR